MKRDKSPAEAQLRRRGFYLNLPQETLRAILDRKGLPATSDVKGTEAQPTQPHRLSDSGKSG